jgi:hypothetical protein
MLNPSLKKGDRVILLHMDGETSVPPGTMGTVLSHSRVFGDDQYTVDWDSGSKLAIISSVDLWNTEENRNQSKKKVEERVITKKSITEIDGANKVFLKNIDVFKFFNMKFLHEYLKDVRESSIVNMFGASPYLYMGRERIEHEFKYKEIHDEEAFETVLEKADRAQMEMIGGVMKYLESQGKEITPESVNRFIPRFASKVLENYMHLF